jgi:hypothetical protein
MLSRYGTKKILRALVFIVIIFVVLGYSLFATHDFILGPTITVTEPTNAASFSNPSIRIKGVVKRIQEITLNGRSITIDDKGNFNEAVLLAPGYNVFMLGAHDKFGRSKDYRLELIYKVN